MLQIASSGKYFIMGSIIVNPGCDFYGYEYFDGGNAETHYSEGAVYNNNQGHNYPPWADELQCNQWG